MVPRLARTSERQNLTPPVSKTPLSSSLGLPLLTAAAIALGVPLGRSLQQSPQKASTGTASSKGGTDPSRLTLSKSGQNGASSEAAEAAADAEFSRLLGEKPPAESKRTPLQSMAVISAAYQEKSELRRFLGIYESVSELGKESIGEALERARAENNPIAVRALERR